MQRRRRRKLSNVLGRIIALPMAAKVLLAVAAVFVLLVSDLLTPLVDATASLAVVVSIDLDIHSFSLSPDGPSEPAASLGMVAAGFASDALGVRFTLAGIAACSLIVSMTSLLDPAFRKMDAPGLPDKSEGCSVLPRPLQNRCRRRGRFGGVLRLVSCGRN